MNRTCSASAAALLALLALLLTAALCTPARAVEVPGAYRPAADPVRDALEALTPKRLGVDSAGLLWAAGDERVIFLDGDGGVVRSVDLPAAAEDAADGSPAVHGDAVRDLAADSRWGVVLLDNPGTRLRWVDLEGRAHLEIPLPDAAAHVAWVDADRVALGLSLAADGVEIRPLRGDAPVRRLWPGVPPVAATPGLYFERSLVLAARGGRLYALDSVGGELRVFSLADGSEVQRATLPDSRLEDLESWRSGLSRTLRSAGRVRSALYTVLRLGVGDDGAAWVVSDCRTERRRAVLHRVPPAAGTEGARPEAVQDFELPLERACCSLDFARWGERLVFNLNLPPAACNQVQTFVPPTVPPASPGGGD